MQDKAGPPRAEPQATNGGNTTAERIGFVGLGIMGKPMARNFMAAGSELTVDEIVGRPVDEWATEGATAASSPASVRPPLPQQPGQPDVQRLFVFPAGHRRRLKLNR